MNQKECVSLGNNNQPVISPTTFVIALNNYSNNVIIEHLFVDRQVGLRMHCTVLKMTVIFIHIFPSSFSHWNVMPQTNGILTANRFSCGVYTINRYCHDCCRPLREALITIPCCTKPITTACLHTTISTGVKSILYLLFTRQRQPLCRSYDLMLKGYSL